MDKIMMIEGRELTSLINGLANFEGTIHTLRLCVDGDQVKFKVNQHTWSLGMGKLDPECQAAQDNRHPFRPYDPTGFEVTEAEEPELCWCGKHYKGAACDHAVSIDDLKLT